MKLAVITLERSIYGLRLLNELSRRGCRVEVVIVASDGVGRRWRLLRRVARQVGWVNALILAAARLLAEWRATRAREWRGEKLVRDYEALAGFVLRTRSLRDAASGDALGDHGIDLVLLGQSGIVPEALLAIPTVGTLNAHPGWLPDYRGLDSPLWAVLADEFDKVASTLHLVDVGIDTGPIIECRQYRWRGDETVASLEASVGGDCIDLLLHGVELASLGQLPTAGVAQGPGRYHGLVSPRLRRTAERKLARFLAGSGANRDSDPRRGHEYRP